MERVSLTVKSREDVGKKSKKKARKDGFIPCVICDHGKTSHHIVEKNEFLNKFYKKGERNLILDLFVDDSKKPASVMVKDVQTEPMQGGILHVDFKKISLTEKIRINVAIEIKSEPIGVKRDGGVLEHVMWELEVECLASAIPEKIEVDVSNLEISKPLCVKDIAVAKGIRILNDPSQVVMVVKPPMTDEALEATKTAEGTGPEVIMEKKQDEEAKPDAKKSEAKKTDSKKPETKE